MGDGISKLLQNESESDPDDSADPTNTESLNSEILLVCGCAPCEWGIPLQLVASFSPTSGTLDDMVTSRRLPSFSGNLGQRKI
jgi:hypothetical protein